MPEVIAKWWAGLSLFKQFILASLIVPCIGMISLGFWIADRIEDGVVQSMAAAAALYTDALVAPHVQELARSDSISAEAKLALDGLLASGMTGKRITEIKIWKGDSIIYGTDKQLVGKTFRPTANRLRALNGEVVVQFDKLEEPDEVEAKALNLPILEFYAPIREDGTHKIIAIAETYEVVPSIAEKLTAAKFKSWVAVAIATLHLIGLQSIVVRRGSRKIEEQQHSLNDRVHQLSVTLNENEALRITANAANRRVSEINEHFLNRLGADLHDGPVQLLGMSLLRLDTLTHVVSKADRSIRKEVLEDVVVIRDALKESLEEIRSVSGGLAPPEIEKMPLSGALEMVAKRHQRRTGHRVQTKINKLPDSVPFPLKVCLYRFAQEGLNNAFRHAAGSGQTVAATCVDNLLEVAIIDTGPGIGIGPASTKEAVMAGGQGLRGLRDRVESLGGKFAIDSSAGQGTCLTARFKLNEGVSVNV